VLIASNFTGADVVLFGSVERDAQTVARRGGYDIVVTVSGPRETIVTFRKQRIAGIWVNADQRTFVRVPSYLTVLANRTINESPTSTRCAAQTGLCPHLLPQEIAGAMDPIREDPFHRTCTARAAAFYRAAELVCLHPGAVPRRDPDPRQRADGSMRPT
jgi:uncharacterized protein (TIGR02186 family)